MTISRRREVRRTTLISVGLTGLLVGLFASYYGAAAHLYWLGFIVIVTPFIYKKKYAALGSVVLVCVMLGIWRGSVVYQQLQKYNQLYGKTITITGNVADDSGFDELHGVTEFHLYNLRTTEGTLLGRLQISTRDTRKVTRGDLLHVTGKLKSSKGTSRQGTISSATFKILKKNISWVEKVRTRFFTVVTSALPEPQASLGLGYLVGVRVSIPEELNDQLAVVGLTHIVAVSGYNLTIIVQAVRRLIGKKSAYQSVVFSGLLITGFVIVAGGSAPITRAAVVCGFSLLAWYYGRVIRPVLLLLLSGALTAFASPLYVWGDPGWYLSFLAFGGVLILAPLITRRIFIKKSPNTVVQILVETLCAQACTIPYTLFLFGGVSIIAPVANVLVLPFIPFIMLTIFIVGVVGIALPVVAALFGVIPSALLTFQTWIIQKLSTVPGAHAEIKITAQIMIALFLLIILAVVLLNRSVHKMKQSQRSEADIDLL